MATDIGRIGAAHVGVAAVEFDGPEKVVALRALDALELAVTQARVRERQAAYESVADRPKILNSEADYENAPLATVVEDFLTGMPYVKNWDGWRSSKNSLFPSSMMARRRRDVVKWGDE